MIQSNKTRNASRYRREKSKIDVIDYTLPNGTEVGRAVGRFDPYCVFVKQAKSLKYVTPLDVDYFDGLNILAKTYSKEKVYKDFCSVFDVTDDEVQQETFQQIHDFAQGYGKYNLKAEAVFAVLYLTMYAEQMKQNAVLKKYVKRLGLHALLFKGLSSVQAADFMKYVDWRILAKMCKLCGFEPDVADCFKNSYNKFWEGAPEDISWETLVLMCQECQADHAADRPKKTHYAKYKGFCAAA